MPPRKHVVVADQTLTVAVMWAQPALSAVGQGILPFPLLIERCFDLRAAP
jgi:hypothetical protein